MDAVEFLKEKERMCRSYTCESCVKCPCDDINNGFDMTCDCLAGEKPEEFVAIIEKWSVEHPAKTRQSEFLKIFPNADLMRSGVVNICPRYTDVNCRKQDECCDTDCGDCMKEFWLSEID